MASDRSFEVNDVVTVHSLVKRTEFNGCQGIVKEVNPDRTFVVIKLLDEARIRLWTANLRHGVYNNSVQVATANSSLFRAAAS